MASKTGHSNSAYDNYGDNEMFERNSSLKRHAESSKKPQDVENGSIAAPVINDPDDDRPTWTNKTHFLMSCIQTSVGLGNIWRFPFTAYENGGGAFLIPYIIVLFIIGKPMYYLETFLGQFTSKSSIKIWAVNPAFRGVGVGQIISTISVVTYYSSLIALTVFYFFASFAWVLPWSKCLEEWGSNCVDSQPTRLENGTHNMTHQTEQSVSSSELYFLRVVLNESLDISKGIGYPSWQLILCLLASWTIVFLVIARGIKSSGKASYFLALFPYVIMVALLVRAVTLQGAGKGILYFLTPQWAELLNPKVWSAAIQQVFFSLTVGLAPVISFSSYNQFDHKFCNLSLSTGALVMFGSYNKFENDFYKDVLIVTTLDTFTSLLAGITIFGILGNLAHNLGLEDIKSVVKSGTGLAFISYPDAISKFDFFPQGFAVLFFFMLFTLGIGSVVGLQNCLVTVVCDQFPGLKYGRVAAVASLLGFLGGLVYLTPGGQWMVTLVDNFGGTMLLFLLGIFELVGIFWIYGIENFALDLEFTTGRKATFYWRFCWIFLSPVTMILVFFYSVSTMKPLRYSGLEFPQEYVVAGWSLLAIGMIQLPIWFSFAYAHNSKKMSACDALSETFKPNKHWGPRNAQKRIEWLKYKEEAKQRYRIAARNANHSTLRRKLYIAFDKY